MTYCKILISLLGDLFLRAWYYQYKQDNVKASEDSLLIEVSNAGEVGCIQIYCTSNAVSLENHCLF